VNATEIGVRCGSALSASCSRRAVHVRSIPSEAKPTGSCCAAQTAIAITARANAVCARKRATRRATARARSRESASRMVRNPRSPCARRVPHHRTRCAFRSASTTLTAGIASPACVHRARPAPPPDRLPRWTAALAPGETQRVLPCRSRPIVGLGTRPNVRTACRRRRPHVPLKVLSAPTLHNRNMPNARAEKVATRTSLFSDGTVSTSPSRAVDTVLPRSPYTAQPASASKARLATTLRKSNVRACRHRR
jgi:hypothetical protein